MWYINRHPYVSDFTSWVWNGSGGAFVSTPYPAVTAVKTGSVLRPASFINIGSASSYVRYVLLFSQTDYTTSQVHNNFTSNYVHRNARKFYLFNTPQQLPTIIPVGIDGCRFRFPTLAVTYWYQRHTDDPPPPRSDKTRHAQLKTRACTPHHGRS